MARRRWDDPWQRYPESVPLPAEGGMATSKQRGAMASSWWSRRFVDVLESYGLGSRMQRGRRYARSGQVVSFDVQAGMVVAQVQGSRRTPYVVTVGAAPPTAQQWASVDAALASFFLIVTLVLVLVSVREWLAIVRGRKIAVSRETPFVQTAWEQG